MSAIPQPGVLSRTIAVPLRQVGRRRWQLATGRGAMQMLIVSLTVWLAGALVAGSLADPARPVRIGLAAIAWGAVAASLIVFLRPMFRRSNLATIARQVESDLDDRRELFSSAVELSSAKDARFAGSPQLVAHLLQQAGEAARGIQPKAIVPLTALGRWAMALFPVLLCWAVLFPAMPTPIRRGLHILMTPWRTQLPAGLAAVEVTPGDITIAEGEPLEITGAIAPRLRSKPTVGGASLEMRVVGGAVQSIAMTRTGDRAFKYAIDHAIAGFQYRITSEDGSSGWYTAKVMPRPTLAVAGIVYTYPAYTKLSSKSDASPEGSIEALVGTEVAIKFHASQPLAQGTEMKVGERTNDERTVPLVTGQGTDYVAKFSVTQSTQYKIDIANVDGLHSREPFSASITAIADQPPVVSITAPQAKINATADDTVTVIYKASDDFGLTRLEALIQIDGQPAEVIPLPLGSGSARVAGHWELVLPEQLARKNLKAANHIEYQLRVTDNREPNPQTGLSAKQVIDIDHTLKASLAAKAQAEAIKNLTEAMKAAIVELKSENGAAEPLIKGGDGRVLSAALSRSLADLKDNVVKTGVTLRAVTDKNLDGPVADLAAAVKKVTDGPIRTAGDALANAVLESDQIDSRQKRLHSSTENLDSARISLEALLAQLAVEAKHQELAHTLSDLARHEDQIAKELAKPEKQRGDRGQAQREQQAIRQRLEEVLNQNKELDTPAAREAAQRNQQLVQKIEQLEEQQKKLDGLAEKQAAVNEAQAPLTQLAQQQKDLNRAIEAFTKAESTPLKDANAHPPADQKLDSIVEALEQPNRQAEGNQKQREAANELKQAAAQLQNSSKASDAAPAKRQQQDKADSDRAKAAAKEAAELTKQISAAKDAKDPAAAKEAIKQKETQLAQKLDQQANEMKARDPARKDAIEAAQREAAQAKTDADAGDAAKAEQELADAAAKLDAVAAGDSAAAQAEQKEMAADAQKASDLAKQQQQLADATAKAAEALAKARQQQGDPQQLERGEQMAASQAEQVAAEANQDAQKDAQQAQGEMEQRAAAVQKDLADAAQHEKAAAKAAAEKQSAQAATEQKAAEQSLAKAEQDARGQPHSGEAAANKPAAEQASSQQLMQQAAAHAQEARQAQQEAASGKAEAANEAGKALNEAAKAVEAAGQKEASQLAQAAAREAANHPPGQGEESGQASNTPGPPKPGSPSSATETRGAMVESIASVDGRPDSVKEIGISASDWARLPPLSRDQLLNAAQQGGPPGYQEKIKNYFVKIAKIQADREGK
jgi:hypothetical protein